MLLAMHGCGSQTGIVHSGTDFRFPGNHAREEGIGTFRFDQALKGPLSADSKKGYAAHIDVDAWPLQRQSLYKILSPKGNPTLEALREILQQVGLRLSVATA